MAPAEDLRRARPAAGRGDGLLALVGVGAVAAVGRAAWVVSQRDRPPSSDGWASSTLGRAVAEGTWFTNPLVDAPTALHPPGWALVLAGVSWLGIDTVTGHQVVAALLGALSVVLIGLVGREVAGRRAGLAAATLAAVHPALWVWERELASEVLLVPLLAALVLVAYRFRTRPGLGAAALMGALVGALVLVRSEQALLGLLVVGPTVLRPGWAPPGRRVAAAGLAGLVALGVVAPWVISNQGRFAEPVVLTTGTGVTLRYANTPATYHGDLLGYGDPAVWAAPSPGDESESDRRDRRLALDHMADEPGRLPVVVLAREGRTWGLFRPLQQADLDRSWGHSPAWTSLAGLAVTWASIPLAVVGGRRLRRAGTTLVPLLALVAVTVLNVAVTYGQPRYRVPADVALVLLAGVGVDALLRRRARRPDPGDDAVIDLREHAPAPVPVGAAH